MVPELGLPEIWIRELFFSRALLEAMRHRLVFAMNRMPIHHSPNGMNSGISNFSGDLDDSNVDTN